MQETAVGQLDAYLRLTVCVYFVCVCVYEREGVKGWRVGGGKKKQTELRRQKVVAAVWGTEFIQFHAALQI